MSFNDTQGPAMTARAIDALVSLERPALSAQGVLELSGLANLVVLARVRMGFPPETFALAAQPLIERYAEYVQLEAVSGSLRYGGPGGRLHRALAIALRALDHRRGQILPRNAPPETLGSLAHRWTYAVFAAALLRDVGSEPAADAARRFEAWVPELIQRWLGEDALLMAELRAVLTGAADPSSAIAELVERAATGARPAIAVAVPPDAPEPLSSAADATAEPAPTRPEVSGPEFLDGVDDTGSERARRFMAWMKQGVADGALPVNVRGALVHRVEEGLLLVSPGIFREFVRREGTGRDEPRDAAKRLQREVLRAGWHLRTDGGVNLHGYAWRHDGGAGRPHSRRRDPRAGSLRRSAAPGEPSARSRGRLRGGRGLMAYPLEARLRPAHELGAASVSALGAAMVLSSPGLFLVTPPWHFALAGALIGHALWRGAAGLRTLRYRVNLQRRRRYELSSAEIPWSTERLFLGRGFRWDQRHTQRLFEARLPVNQPLLQGGPLAGVLTGFVSAADSGSVGGDPAIHGVEPDESEIWMDLEDRVGHTLVLGTTRVGKTRLAELLIAQDIRRGEVVVVFDPKGDVDLLRRVYAEAERAGRAGEFFMFHLGHPEISARYNPVGSFSRITEVATRIAGQLPSEGQSAAFKEFVWRFVNVMARALVALGRKPDYQEINRYASDVEPLLIDYFEYWLDREPAASDWREELRSLAIDKKNLDKGLQSRGAQAVSLVEYARRKKLYDPIAHALASTLNYEKSHFDKLVASLLPLMEKLTTGRTASLLSPELDDPTDWRPVFDWTSVIHLGGIVYVGLDALSDYEVAAAVGNSMFADLTSVAGSLYKFGTGRGLPGEVKPRRIAIHADEFNELIGDEFIPLLNKAGGAGFQVTAYTQTWSDVEARIGSPAKAGQIAGNFNTLIMLRVKEVATAELLTSQLPEVHVVSTVVSSSVSDTNDPVDFADFASRNEDRIAPETVRMLEPTDLVQLPKGEAFALIHGGQLHKIRMPLPSAASDPLMPASLAAIGTTLRARLDGPWNRLDEGGEAEERRVV